MKNKINILSVVVLTAIYCFAIDTVNNSLIHSDYSSNSSSSKENVISVLSKISFYHTSQSESSVTNYNNLLVQNIKNQFNELWANIKTNEQRIASEFSQYTIFARNILINHRKSDIIFPFNYFW